jgi:dTDP-4-dehydrorhamnose reductase
MSRILLTGGTGQLGTALLALDWPAGTVILAPGTTELDLSSEISIASYLDRQWFDCVVNCAACTAVDKAEAEPELAHSINGLAPGQLAEWCAQHKIPMLHVSTDFVFDGNKSGPYREDDPTGPINVYGQSKRAGERAVQASGARHVIVRTSWLVSPNGHNFVRTMLRLAAERDVVKVVDDQYGAPTVAADLAGALRRIALRHMEEFAAPSGIFHCTNAGETTWHGLANAVFGIMGERGHKVPELQALTTAEYPTAASRPANSRLDCRRIEVDFGISLPHWTVALADMMQHMVPATLKGETGPEKASS